MLGTKKQRSEEMKKCSVLSVLIRLLAFYLLICLPYDCTDALWSLVEYAKESIAIGRAMEVVPLACIIATVFWIVFCMVFYVMLVVKSDFIADKLCFGRTEEAEMTLSNLSFDQTCKICVLCAGLFFLIRGLPDCAAYIGDIFIAVAENTGMVRSNERLLSYVVSRLLMLLVQLFFGFVFVFRPSKVLKYIKQ